MTAISRFALTLSLVVFTTSITSAESIRLLQGCAVSPDGQTLAFAWAGDIWSAATAGGDAVRITRDPANDRQPAFSPDGKLIAFTSNRQGGGYQIYTVPVVGGEPRQQTFHSEGYQLHEWSASGAAFLTSGRRDHFYRSASRHLLVDRNNPKAAETLLFDAAGHGGRLSPNGKRILFVREGAPTYRKGYRGSEAGQIWIYGRVFGEYEQLLADEMGFRSPRWKPNGSGFYYVGQQSGSFNLWSMDFKSGARTQLTFFEDDSVLWPALSRDGSTLVFRHLFDLYRMDLRAGTPPEKIELRNGGEPKIRETEREVLTAARSVAFTDDGLEVAFTAGGDVWVMDTELREPRQITATPEEEREPMFSADGETLYFVSDAGGQTDIWSARRKEADLYWWQNESFGLDPFTRDSAVESRLDRSPDGETLAYLRGRGDLMLVGSDGKNPRRFLEAWNRPSYSFSPDGQWIAYSVDDDDFNEDVWISRVDGTTQAFNLSTHPDYDGNPTWSPDGRMLAFTGRRAYTESDIYYVYLQAKDAEEGSRDRTLEKALEKMKKGRKGGKKKGGSKKPGAAAAEPAKVDPDPGSADPGSADPGSADPGKADPNTSPSDSEEKPGKQADKSADLPAVRIDFDGIRDRIQRLFVADSRESGLLWIGDQKLAFSARIGGSSGIYTVQFPDELQPKKITTTRAMGARYLAKSKTVVGLVSGTPASLTTSGKLTRYSFRCQQQTQRSARYRAGFLQAWRAMRDGYYDERLGNRNWDAIRRKYEDAAAGAYDPAAFEEVVELMLGELNGSHLGFSARWRGYRADVAWTDTTAHLGVRFDPEFHGPGWRVRDVIPDTPAAEERSRLAEGDVILAIDGVSVDPSMAVSHVLNGARERDVTLRVLSPEGEERDVSMRPTSYGNVRRRLYSHWMTENRARVAKDSKDSLGYLHIRGMNWSSFLKFEEELYRVAAGKDGLIIDVRGNGGGSTADHLLTVLTQPHHAITVPRGGGQGYPQGRRVYATWRKPIVVLCDQDSFSNAEIFAHAVKNLGRGHLVGVTTAGGVISTGGRSIAGMGFIRMPFRGWYIAPTGEDMELNGAVPDHTVWPAPGALPAGNDAPLDKAVEVLLQDVAEWQARPRPNLRKASERGAKKSPSSSARF